MQRNQELLAKHCFFFNYNQPVLPQLNQLLATPSPSLHKNQQANGTNSSTENTIDEQRLQKFERLNEAIERTLSRETYRDISNSLSVLKQSLKEKKQLLQEKKDAEICQKTDKCQLQISVLQKVQQNQDDSQISLGKRTEREEENIKEPICEVRDEDTQKSWADISSKSSQSLKSLQSQGEQPRAAKEKVVITFNTTKTVQSKNFGQMVQNRISNQSNDSIKRKRISQSKDVSCYDIQQSHTRQKLGENIGNSESQQIQQQMKEKEVEEPMEQQEILLQKQPQDQLSQVEPDQPGIRRGKN
eukprot:403357091